MKLLHQLVNQPKQPEANNLEVLLYLLIRSSGHNGPAIIAKIT